MLRLLQYNWQIRDEWFNLLEHVPEEELLRERVGGMGSILKTLYHIVDVEYSWIRGLVGKPDLKVRYEDYKQLKLVIGLSERCRGEIKELLQIWTSEMDSKPAKVSWSNEMFTHGEILRHVIAHEIHHIGQLSIWARELDVKVVSTNFIGKGL